MGNWESEAAAAHDANRVSLPGCSRCANFEAHNATLTARIAELEATPKTGRFQVYVNRKYRCSFEAAEDAFGWARPRLEHHVVIEDSVTGKPAERPDGTAILMPHVRTKETHG